MSRGEADGALTSAKKLEQRFLLAGGIETSVYIRSVGLGWVRMKDFCRRDLLNENKGAVLISRFG